MKQEMAITSMHWKELYEQYKIYINSLNYTMNNHRKSYRHIQEFIGWMEKNHKNKISQLVSNDIFNYLDYLKNRKQKNGRLLSNLTINSHLFSIKLLFDYAYQIGLINHTIPMPKYIKKNTEDKLILTLKEIQQLFTACENPRDKAMLVILYGCGLRRTEAHWLDVSEVQLHHGVIYVLEGKGRRNRKIPLSKTSINILKEYERIYRLELLRRRNDQLVEPAYLLTNKGYRMGGDAMYKKLLSIVKKTKNKELIEKNICLHTLRHSIATHLLDKKVDIDWIQIFLGHSNLDSTYIYIKNRKRLGKLYM